MHHSFEIVSGLIHKKQQQKVLVIKKEIKKLAHASLVLIGI